MMKMKNNVYWEQIILSEDLGYQISPASHVCPAKLHKYRNSLASLFRRKKWNR